MHLILGTLKWNIVPPLSKEGPNQELFQLVTGTKQLLNHSLYSCKYLKFSKIKGFISVFIWIRALKNAYHPHGFSSLCCFLLLLRSHLKMHHNQFTSALAFTELWSPREVREWMIREMGGGRKRALDDADKVATPQWVAAKFLVGKDPTSLGCRYIVEMHRKSTSFLPIPAILSWGSFYFYREKIYLAYFNLYF